MQAFEAAILTGIAAVLALITLPIVIGGLALVFRDSIGDFIKQLAKAIPDRSVTIDIHAVKVQVGERPVSEAEQQTTLLSRSPLEIGPDPVVDRPEAFEIPPQLAFPVSDSGATAWANEHVPAALTLMDDACGALKSACEKKLELRKDLEEFAGRLEAVRFSGARRLADLIELHPALDKLVNQLQVKDPKALAASDLLILQAIGIAYAQKGKWALGRAALEKIVVGNDPPYLPAADVWLACAYHDYIKHARTDTPPVELDSPDFLTRAEPIVQHGRDFAARMKIDDFKNYSVSPDNISYYKSSLAETLGDVISILAEYSTDAALRKQRLEEGENYLIQAWRENQQPLTCNSLADVNRQLGKYPEAHQLLDQAFKDSLPAPDPALYHTRALIFWKEGSPLKGLFAVQQYDESKVKDGAADDAQQYVENQILAAQLAAAVDCDGGDQYVALAAGILESARAFLDKRAALLGESVQDFRIRIDELLGFAYLQVKGRELRAVEAFDRLSVCAASRSLTEISWRQRLGRAKALTRLARSQRRSFSSQLAAADCERANALLADSGAAIKQFGIDAAVPVGRRRRRALLYLDTATAIQELAEENFCEGNLKTAADLLGHSGGIIVSLGDALGLDLSLCRELESSALLDKVSKRTRLVQAQRCFLLGRIAIGMDPSLNESGLLDRVEAIFNAARGVESDLDCRIDLELGELLLRAALAKKGDVKTLYRRSLNLLEAAAGRDVPLLRAETVRALADAYSRTAAVSRIASESSKSA